MGADVESQKPRPAFDAPLDDVVRGASPVVVLNAGAKCRGLIARVAEIQVSIKVFACPPEDVGGPPGYVDFVQAISDPEHPEHEELLEWCGGTL